MDDFLQLPREDYPTLFEKYAAIDQDYKGIPVEIRANYFDKVQKLIAKQKEPLLTLLRDHQ